MPLSCKAPLENVAIDVIGELITMSRENKCLLVASDRITKLVKTVPMKTDSAMEVARHFVHELVFNLPAEL